jgi:hypothetical protein
MRNGVGGWKCGVGVALLATSLSLAASPPPVITQATASVNTDYALFFTLDTHKFAEAASNEGVTTLPGVVSFRFDTGYPAPSGLWAALLETPEGSVIGTFPEFMEFETAQYLSPEYSGPVGEIEGSLPLSPAASQQLGDSRVVLVLLNLGPTATVGLPPYLIADDLTVSLSGGRLTTSAPVVEVTLADPAPPCAPEPRWGWLFTARALQHSRERALGHSQSVADNSSQIQGAATGCVQIRLRGSCPQANRNSDAACDEDN